jgi:hypothetical protein
MFPSRKRRVMRLEVLLQLGEARLGGSGVASLQVGSKLVEIRKCGSAQDSCY